jgi:Flp pilus assembly protein TadG
VEFALTAPLLLLFVFAAIEFSYANLIRNVMENAAVEGAREGILPGATPADCLAAADDYLGVMGINNASVTVTPSVFDSTTQTVTVTVSIPLAENSMPMSRFVLGQTLNQTITLPRETQ